MMLSSSNYEDAAHYYRLLMSAGGNIPEKFPEDSNNNQKDYAKAIQNCFDAMATEEERRCLLPPTGLVRSGGGAHSAQMPDEGKRNEIQERLRKLVMAGLVDLYIQTGLMAPDILANAKKLEISSPYTHLKAIKKARSERAEGHGLGVPPDLRDHFQKLRARLVKGEQDIDDLTAELGKKSCDVSRLFERIPGYEAPHPKRGGKKRKKESGKESGKGSGGSGHGGGGGGPPPAAGGAGSMVGNIMAFLNKSV